MPGHKRSEGPCLERERRPSQGQVLWDAAPVAAASALAAQLPSHPDQRASVWRIPRALCQRRHLPEAISGTRDLPVCPWISG